MFVWGKIIEELAVITRMPEQTVPPTNSNFIKRKLRKKIQRADNDFLSV